MKPGRCNPGVPEVYPGVRNVVSGCFPGVTPGINLRNNGPSRKCVAHMAAEEERVRAIFCDIEIENPEEKRNTFC